jgi:dolichol-phosphate mannosyltransferase
LPETQLSVVMPAYLEAESLKQLLPAIAKAAADLCERYEILVVDATEPLDDTARICALNGVRHLHRSGGNAYGDAVRTGLGHAGGEFFLLMDADGSHDPKYIKDLWNARHRADVVIGSRYVPGGRTENPLPLIWMSRILNYMYKFAFRIPVNDVSNSFRLYRGDQVRALTLVSNDFDIVEEILIRLIFGPARARVVEIPVSFERRMAGRTKRNLLLFMVSYYGSIRRLRKFRAGELKNRRGSWRI